MPTRILKPSHGPDWDVHSTVTTLDPIHAPLLFQCAEVAVASLRTRTVHDEWVIEVLPESDWTLCQKYDDFLAKGRVTT